MTLQTMSFIFGALLLAVAILGGALEVKEIKVSNVTKSGRTLAGLVGLVFIGLGFWQPNFATNPDNSARPAATPIAPAATTSERPAATPIAPTVTMSEREHDKDRWGGDYYNFDVSTDHMEDCERVCMADPKCAAWTYVKPGVQRQRAVCYLKNVIPATSDNVCCVSGTKIH